MVYHGMSEESLVFSRYTREPFSERALEENTSDTWDILWYTTRERCTTQYYFYTMP